MQLIIASTALLAWALAVVILFRGLGPRRASTIAVLGGFLILPRYAALLDFPTIERRTIPGLALLLGVLLFDRRSLLRPCPRWIDLPMALFVLSPLLGSAVRGAGFLRGGFDQSWIHLFEWAVPYAMGRLYFGSPGDPKRLMLAIVFAGLAYIPLVLYEAVVGPDRYLAGLIYGTQPHLGMVERLGGWRPEVFLGSGIELAAWMALATIVAAWLATCRDGCRPALAAVPALAMTTLACRGVYGYLILGVGLLATASAQWLRGRWVLWILILLAPTYSALRLSGAWSGRELVDLAGRLGRPSTVSVRLDAEDAFIRDAKAGGLVLGAGGRYPEWQADGWWVSTLKGGGLLGLAAYYAAFLTPAAWATRRRPLRSPDVGLALFITLHVLDGLHNTSIIAPTTLIGGALLARWPIAREDDRGQAGGPGRPRNR